MVVGWILVTHDGNGGLKSCDHRHGVGVKKGVKWGSEEDCYLNFVSVGFWSSNSRTLDGADASTQAVCAL